MEKILECIAEKLSYQDCEKLEAAFENFARDASISDDEQQRILSSVMGKAGFEMKGNMTEKRIKRHNRRFMGFMIAAAVVATGAIGVGAYTYSNGMWNAMSDRFDESTIEQDAMPKLASVMKNYDGVVLENTFEGLDFTYEGVINDGNEAYVILTISKSNGEPFELSEGGAVEIAYRRESAKITDGNYDTELYPYSIPFVIDKVNDDGSVTAMLNITNAAVWFTDAQGFFDGTEPPISDEYVLSFSNIYVLPDNESFNAGFSHKPDIENYYIEGDHERSDQALQDRFEHIAKYASECYEGTLTFSVDTRDDNSTHMQTVDGDVTVDVWLSSISVRTMISDENGYDIYEGIADSETISTITERSIPVEVHFKDGTVLDENSCWGWISEGENEYPETDKEPECYYPISVTTILGFSSPIDPSEVDYITVDGYKVDF